MIEQIAGSSYTRYAPARFSSSLPYPPESSPTPSARARRAASMSQTLSPTTTELRFDAELARRHEEQVGIRLGVGHQSRVITGTSGTPSMSIAGPALSLRPLVAMDQGTRAR